MGVVVGWTLGGGVPGWLGPSISIPSDLGARLARVLQDYPRLELPGIRGRQDKTNEKGAQRRPVNPERDYSPTPNTFLQLTLETGSTEMVDHDWLDTGGDFMREQGEDQSLSHAWEQVVAPEPNRKAEQRVPQGPRFEVREDRLYPVVRDPHTHEELWQLLILQKCQRGLLQLAQSVPWAGPLGREKTLQ